MFQTLSCLESEKHKLRTLISILFIIQTPKYFASLLKLSQRNQLDELKIAEEWEWIKLLSDETRSSSATSNVSDSALALGGL